MNDNGGYSLLAVYKAGLWWLGPKVGGHLASLLYSSREPSELSQWLCHDDSTINIVVVIIIIIIIIIINVLHVGLCVALQESKSAQYFYDAQVIERGSTLPDRGKRKSRAGGPPAKKPR